LYATSNFNYKSASVPGRTINNALQQALPVFLFKKSIQFGVQLLLQKIVLRKVPAPRCKWVAYFLTRSIP